MKQSAHLDFECWLIAIMALTLDTKEKVSDLLNKLNWQEQLDNLNKNDLLAISDSLDLNYNVGNTKSEIKTGIVRQLVVSPLEELGSMSETLTVTNKQDEDEKPSFPKTFTTVRTEELMLEIELKKLEVQQKEIEAQERIRMK